MEKANGCGRLEERMAIVTGGARGIGKAIAQGLADEGAAVVIADIDVEAAEETVGQFKSLGLRVSFYPADLADVSSIRALVDRVSKERGRIDILVNNAGVVQVKPFLAITEADWDRVVDINQKGLFFCIQAAGAQMIRQIPEEVARAASAGKSYGKIVNLSSISGRRGRSDQASYAATKAAIISLTQSAALAFAAYNINVNAVAPSVVATPMWDEVDRERSRLGGEPPGSAMRSFIERIPLRRAGSPQDIAAAVVFLCCPESDYITGQTLNVDGGFEMD